MNPKSVSFGPLLPSIALFSAVLLSAGHAVAQPKSPQEAIAEVKNQYPPCAGEAAEGAIDKAAAAHQQALDAFDKLQFGRAAELWSEAYQHDCSRPKVFVNIGNAYERAGQKAAAIAVYELLLERDTDPAPRIQEKADILRKQVDEEHKKALADEQARQKAAAEAKVTDGTSQPPSQNGEPPLGIVPWIGLGVGGAAMIGGGVLLGVGLSQASSAADQCEDPEARTGCPLAAVDDGEAGETMSQIGQGLLYGGGGLAALSLILQLAVNGDGSDAPEPVAKTTSGPAQAQLGLGINVRF